MSLLETISKISPETLNILEARYKLLLAVRISEPVGRRALSSLLDQSEGFIRNQIDILKDLRLLKSDNMGMYVTEHGISVIEELTGHINEYNGTNKISYDVQKALGVERVIVTPSDVTNQKAMFQELGRAVEISLKPILSKLKVMGVTGGTTMAAIADSVYSDEDNSNVLIVPARGGLGKDIKSQANSVAAKLAANLNAQYKLLYIPDNISEIAANELKKNSEISQVLELQKQMDCLVFGIGRADTLAKRRNLSEAKIKELEENGAVAEAFGHYFDIKGNEIWEYKTPGLSLQDYYKLPLTIGVAGGSEKAEAIIAIANLRKDLTLILDRAVAKRILEII